MTDQLFLITDEALNDIKKISVWYADKSFYLGDDFQNEVFKSIHIICRHPLAYLNIKNAVK